MTNNLYRGFWRWHFYGGLIALPFLGWLALTGSLYLFKPEIEKAFYGNWITLSAAREAAPVSRLIASVERQTGGEVTQVATSPTTAESWRMRVEAHGEARTAFVDPHSGAVLGTTAEGGIMKTVRGLHSLAITGTFGNALIEVAAGWGIVLVVTGVVLWWPRGGQRAVALRGRPGRRLWWRDLHATTGFLAGAIILFLAMTGMPWSVFWGANVQRIVAENGWGRPMPPGSHPWEIRKRNAKPEHKEAASARREALPWTLQAVAVPHGSQTPTIGVDQAVAIAHARGVTGAMVISLPLDPGQPYSFTRAPGKADDAHALYVDAGSGRVLQDVSYAQFGTGAKIIEWGVATHQGQQYGEPNRWVMLAGCAALLLLCGSAPVLWWKRRRAGRLELPPRPHDRKSVAIACAVAAALGILYPLTGATMLLVGLFDYLFFLRRPRQGAAETEALPVAANMPRI